MTYTSSRRARVSIATNSGSRPIAATRDSDGRTTIPSGTPMTPIGIWSRVNATLKLVTAPGPCRVASEVTTTNVICVAPSPIARGAISVSALRASAVAEVDPRHVPEAEAGQRAELDEQVAERPGHDADREPRRPPSMGPGAAPRR